MTPDLQVHSLASGSSGNAMLVQSAGRAVLIDAGVAGRTLVTALGRRGIGAGQLEAVLLTHEHDDHLRGAQAVSSRLGAPIVANAATLAAASARTELPATGEMASGATIELGPFIIRSFRISHDAAEPVGYLIRVGSAAVSYATDVGCPCDELAEAMREASLCVLESNHDLEWLRRGPYPPAMKARILSDRGHLSNLAAVEAMCQRLHEAGPACFWLAHLSKTNNSPSLARRFAVEEMRRRTAVPFTLDVALRDRPSLVWQPGTSATQLSLFE